MSPKCECRNDCRLEISGTLAVFEQKSETKWHFLENLQYDSILCDSSHCDESLALDQDDCFLRDELQSMLLETSNPEKTLQSISRKPVKQFKVSSCCSLTVPNDS